MYYVTAVRTFADSKNSSVVEMPDPLAAECAADGTGAAWQFAPTFAQCNIAQAVVGTADGNGIAWYTYKVYLNYDNAIDASLGAGNLQQLDQVAVKSISRFFLITNFDFIHNFNS